MSRRPTACSRGPTCPTRSISPPPSASAFSSSSRGSSSSRRSSTGEEAVDGKKLTLWRGRSVLLYDREHKAALLGICRLMLVKRKEYSNRLLAKKTLDYAKQVTRPLWREEGACR
eukprot:760824-Hanusia_phi.AAC.1